MSDGREGCGERLWEFGLLTALRRASRGLIRLLAVAFAVLVGSFVSIDIAGAGSAIYATSGHSYDTHAEVAPAHAALGIAATVSGTPAGVLGPSAESAGAPLRLSGELVAPRVGAGSGPWVNDALTTPVPGATARQSLPGSCASACGDVLTAGVRTEAQLLDALGEWSNPQALAGELGGSWRGGGFGSGADALAVANRGPMGAVLQVPGGPGHMVVTSPLGHGRFQVLDPFDGSGYVVDSGWIERYVAGGVFQG